MRNIITVTAYSSMPGRYQVRLGQPEAKRPRNPRDVSGGEAAAAAAMEIAVEVGSKGYAIFAPKEVLQLIPEDMRSRG
ncbi:MAG: hypothetical protein CMK74_12255 [Pseudomonadales bacterium]|nr:hypothetical protein [Pseudomonadales bacterium]|tara:strand:- start:899 stop:1132 length:234 start_codon:yes stop_codon:yes gene_type:complete